jgi:hypothetical protein
MPSCKEGRAFLAVIHVGYLSPLTLALWYPDRSSPLGPAMVMIAMVMIILTFQMIMRSDIGRTQTLGPFVSSSVSVHVNPSELAFEPLVLILPLTHRPTIHLLHRLLLLSIKTPSTPQRRLSPA